MQKLALCLFFFAFTLNFSSQSDAQTETGFDESAYIHFDINQVCLSAITRNKFPGPYQMKVRLFRGVFDPKTKSFKSKKVTLIDRLDGVPFSEFQLIEGSSQGNAVVDQFLSANLAPLPKLELRFEDFQFSIPNHWLTRKVTDVKSLKKNTLLEDFLEGADASEDDFYVLGLQLVVEDISRDGEVTQAKIAFGEGASYLSVNFHEDLNDENSRHLLIYPETAVLFSDQREFYVIDGFHAHPQKNKGCENNDSLSFKIAVDNSEF